MDWGNTSEGDVGVPKLALPLGGGDSMAKKRNYSAPFAKKQWRTAALKAKSLPDPWEGYDYYPTTILPISTHLGHILYACVYVCNIG